MIYCRSTNLLHFVNVFVVGFLLLYFVWFIAFCLVYCRSTDLLHLVNVVAVGFLLLFKAVHNANLLGHFQNDRKDEMSEFQGQYLYN